MTHQRHNRSQVGPVAAAVAVISLCITALALIVWREWSNFAVALPWLAQVLRFAAFLAPVVAAYVGIVTLWRRYGDRQFIQAYHIERITLAQRSQGLPSSITSLNIHPAPPAQLSAAPDAPQLTSGPVAPPSLIDAMSRGLSTPEQWLIGVAQDGTPQTIALRHTGFIALGGIPGTGKTNAAAMLAAQCAAHQGMLFVADPQADDPQSLASRIAPLGAIVRKTPDEINAMVETIARIYTRRNNAQGTYPPLLILLDEFLGLMIRDELTDASLNTLIALAGEGRKKNMFAALVAQNWNMAALGRAGVTIRQLTTATLAFKSKAETARTLLPPAYAQQALTLKPGQTLFFGADEPILTAVPWLSDADMSYAARGRPSMPVAPVLSPHSAPQSTLAPTARVAPLRAAPPTTQIAPPTVPEQIYNLLRQRVDGWMTPTEIAAALQVPLKTVRTEVKEMFDRKLLRRRAPAAKTTNEWYEYAVQLQQVQPVQRGLTPSA